jgi:hypothetical protein
MAFQEVSDNGSEADSWAQTDVESLEDNLDEITAEI